MTTRYRRLLMALAVCVAAAALLAPATMAGPGGMMDDGHHDDGGHTDPGWCAGGIWDGGGHWGGTGTWGTGNGMAWLTGHPDALDAWLQLRAEHLAALRSWHEAYRPDLRSAAAQQALHELWTAYWTALKAFYEQYADGAAWTCPSHDVWGGWQHDDTMGGHHYDATHMWGTGHGAGWLARHPGAFGRWLALREHQVVHARAVVQRHHAELSGDLAQSALKAMRLHHRTQVRSFYRDHALRVTTERMHDGAGGWMGLGGLWGGFGW